LPADIHPTLQILSVKQCHPTLFSGRRPCFFHIADRQEAEGQNDNRNSFCHFDDPLLRMAVFDAEITCLCARDKAVSQRELNLRSCPLPLFLR
jgi:hypothetical protein